MPKARKKKSVLKIIGLAALVCLLAGGLPGHAHAVAGKDLPTQKIPRVESIQIGGHPEYTRILINLNQATPYRVQADFSNKKISLSLSNAALGPDVKSRTFKDPNVEKVEASRFGDLVKIDLYFKNSNSRLIHFTKENPPQIVLDLKGVGKPFVTTKIAKTEIPGMAAPAGKIGKPAEGGGVQLAGMTPEQAQDLIKKNAEEKLLNGWEDYQAALKTFQEKKYDEAAKLFRRYRKDYPKSKYLGEIAYLAAEAQYRVAAAERNPIYEKAFAAYQYAVREYPLYTFQDHSLLKLAQLYEDMGYLLEAKTLYDRGIRANRGSLYNPSRHLGLASLMMKEGRLEEAYTAYRKILEGAPKDDESRKAIFKIAHEYYDRKEYRKALEIYEDAEKRWSFYIHEDPKIFYNMGEIYFRERQYPLARAHYFDLINLSPDLDIAHKSLNRIGDSYFIDGNYLAGLGIFDESSKRNPGTRESQYGTIRMADIGVRDSTLPVRDLIFNASPYYQPFKTYAKVFKEAADADILAEVALSRGRAYLHEQRYLEAIDEFKKLLPLGPDAKFNQEAQKYVKQTLALLVDRFSKQTGYLPILYSFSDYQSLSIGEIDNLKTLVQVGEAYQAVSMYDEAVKYYEKVKRLDSKGVYTAEIFLNLGRIHLEQGNYKEAELVARTFLNQYPQSPKVADAIKLLAGALKGARQYDQALQTYQDLLGHTKENTAEVYYLMGETYSEAKRLPEALQAYQRVIDSYDRSSRIIPDFVPDAYYKLGLERYNAKDYEKARDALKSAKELFPDHKLKDWDAYMLADSLERLKNQDRAAAELNELIKSETTDDLVKKAAEAKLKVMDWEKKFKDFL